MLAKNAVKLGLAYLRHPVYTTQLLRSLSTTKNIDLDAALRNAANWLLAAQRFAPSGEGYSRRYSLISGWDSCYIETTGYIIPTLIDVADYLDEDNYRESAYRAAKWLLHVQTQEGAFTDIDEYRPQVFDTGQVLLGLNRMYSETGKAEFKESMIKAANWLLSVQEKDGSWISRAYNRRPHAYYTRVAASLLETGKLLSEEKYIQAGKRNLEWTLSLRQNNGYFKYSEFDEGEAAFLHTLIYILEGYSLTYYVNHEQRWLDIVVNAVDELVCLLDDNGLLYSQYDSEWNVVNPEYCVTGLAQFSGICFDVALSVNDYLYRNIGRNVIDKVCQWQQTSGEDLEGGLPSSIPVWGNYGSMDLYNWNAKYLIDAILKQRKLEKRPAI